MFEPSAQRFDTIHTVETPEGVDLFADLAGPIPRAMAYATDLAIRLAILACSGIVALLVGQTGAGFWLILSFILEWWYPVIFEMLRQGQTPGKKIFQLTVVNEDLTALTWSSSIIRNLLRAVDFLPFMYVFGLLSLTITSRFQRLGDLAAGTIVIQKNPLSETGVLPNTPTQPPAGSFAEGEQDAIIEFTARHQSLSVSRQQELADILTPITGREGPEAVNYLRAIGNWFLGAR